MRDFRRPCFVPELVRKAVALSAHLRSEALRGRQGGREAHCHGAPVIDASADGPHPSLWEPRIAMRQMAKGGES